MRLFALLLGLVVAPIYAAAQAPPPDRLYEPVPRPRGVSYKVLNTEHFQIIFQSEAESEAREAATLLEKHLPSAEVLTGHGRTMRMPVVLNAYNDRSNGFVATLPFRQEIESAGILGSRLSGRYLSWMQAVVPHELVHATHAQSDAGFGVGQLLRFISPDLARSLNLGLPPGLSEGAAVYYESTVQEGAGRLNFSLFQMKYRAAMASDTPWTLAQVLDSPAYSFPVDRYYSGGANLFSHLAEDDGGQFFRSAKALHYRLPLFGSGVELWHGTGRLPHKLGSEFREAAAAEEMRRQQQLSRISSGRVLASARGRNHRRPQWMNDSTLIAHVSGYDVRTGFYTVETREGNTTLIAHQMVTPDATFSLSKDRSKLLYSRYVRDRFVSTKWVADAFELTISTGKVRRLTRNQRVIFPVEGGESVWVLQNQGQYSGWFRIADEGELRQVIRLDRATFIQVAPSPDGVGAAVLIRREGRQGIYRAQMDATKELILEPWIVFDDASVYDVIWHEEALLFTADIGGVANVYAFRDNQLLQLTNVVYGAMEPSLSPNGATLAYVEYQHERYDLMILPMDWSKTWSVEEHHFANPVTEVRAIEPWNGGAVHPYHPWRHLRPRTLLPELQDSGDGTLTGGALGLGLGLTAQGSDPLRTWSYSIKSYYQAEKFWNSIGVATHWGRLRIDAEGYTEPGTALLIGRQNMPARTVGREFRGAGLGVSLPIYLQSNVQSTKAYIRLSTRLESSRLFALPDQTLPEVAPHWLEFRNRWVISPIMRLRYRMVQNFRDLMPNMGTEIRVQSDADLWNARSTGRRGMIIQASQFFSLSLQAHTGVRLRATLIDQSVPGFYNLERLTPRGYESRSFSEERYSGLDALVVQPIWFVDNGLVILPVYLKVLYLFGFAEAMYASGSARSYRSVGLGLGMEFRIFHYLDLELRLGGAFLPDERRFAWTQR